MKKRILISGMLLTAGLFLEDVVRRKTRRDADGIQPDRR